jgi:hypothetical protein
MYCDGSADMMSGQLFQSLLFVLWLLAVIGFVCVIDHPIVDLELRIADQGHINCVAPQLCVLHSIVNGMNEKLDPLPW